MDKMLEAGEAAFYSGDHKLNSVFLLVRHRGLCLSYVMSLSPVSYWWWQSGRLLSCALSHFSLVQSTLQSLIGCSYLSYLLLHFIELAWPWPEPRPSFRNLHFRHLELSGFVVACMSEFGFCLCEYVRGKLRKAVEFVWNIILSAS